MQSLILATSLVMSTPVTIEDINSSAELDQLISQQTQHVSELVTTQVENVTQDTFLVQAKLALNVSQNYIASVASVKNDGAE
jgi:hypothetical protein